MEKMSLRQSDTFPHSGYEKNPEDLSTDITQQQTKNKDWIRTNINTLLTSDDFCVLCLKKDLEMFPLDKKYSVSGNNRPITLKSIVDCLLNVDIADTFPSYLICKICTEKLIQSYIFIEDSKNIFNILNHCVNDLYSKVIDIGNELDDCTDFGDSNVMIVVEYDEKTYNLVDGLTINKTESSKETVNAERITSGEKEKNISSNYVVDGKKNVATNLPKTETKTAKVILPSNSLNKNTGKSLIIKPKLRYFRKNNSGNLTIDKNVTDPKSIDLKENSNEQQLIKTPKIEYPNEDYNREITNIPNITLKEGNLIIEPLKINTTSTAKYNIYSCNYCPSIFPMYRSLKEHEKIKHKLVIYNCLSCDKVYSTQQYLDVHYRTAHNKARCKFCKELFEDESLNKHLKEQHAIHIEVCQLCDLVFYTSEQLETHVKSNHFQSSQIQNNKNRQCVMCLRAMPTEMAFTTHKCKFSCLECTVMPCIHYSYLMAYREQVLNRSNTFKCIDCDYITKRKEHLLSHVNREHLDHHPFTCDDCGTQFYTKLSLKTHIVMFHQNFKCQFCDHEFTNKKSYENHLVLCKTVTREFSCVKCQASFHTNQRLDKHITERHSDVYYPCRLCKKEYPNRTALKEHHAKVHTAIQIKKRKAIIECTICDITLKNVKDMSEHEKMHPSETFPCKECPKSFSSLKKVYIHKQLHYSQKTKCSICHKLVALSYLGQHKLLCQIQKGEILHTCEICGKTFQHESNLVLHQKKLHTEAIQCKICDKFIKPSSMDRHLALKHGNPETNEETTLKSAVFNCDFCSFWTKKSNALENHINRMHLKIKPYACQICLKTFCGKLRLLEHTKTHKEDSVCYCPHCQKRFANKVCLKMHIRKHTGENPYECNICFKKFRSSSIMKTHRLKKHQDKNVACPLCDSMYHLVTEMRYHVKKVHWNRDEPFDHRKIVPEEFHHLFNDRRMQRLGDDSL